MRQYIDTYVFGTDQDGGEREFDIQFEYEDTTGSLLVVHWPDTMEDGIYYDDECVTEQIKDHIKYLTVA